MPSPARKRSRGSALESSPAPVSGAKGVGEGTAHPVTVANTKHRIVAAAPSDDDHEDDDADDNDDDCGGGGGGGGSDDDDAISSSGGSNSEEEDSGDDLNNFEPRSGEDVLQAVGRHLGPALQRAWAVDKDCDVALRLKRHTLALESMREEFERQRLCLVIRVVTEAAAGKAEAASTSAAVAPSCAVDQFVYVSAQPRTATISNVGTRGRARGDHGNYHQHDAVNDVADDSSPFSTAVEDDVSAVVQALSVRWEVSDHCVWHDGCCGCGCVGGWVCASVCARACVWCLC